MGFAPAQVVEGPPRLPLPFGLFSVASLAESATERWENGVTWEALSCDPAGIVVGDCDAPEGFPKEFPDGQPSGKAAAFTVYGAYKCGSLGHADALNHGQAQARALLAAREEQGAEARLWTQMAQDVDSEVVGTAGDDVIVVLGTLEQWIADNYGSLGVVHASRNAATTLGQKGLLDARGGQLTTKLGTPVVAGGGYPGTGRAILEEQVVTITGAPTGGTFTLTFEGETTAPIDFDATAGDVQAALEALGAIEPGDVEATGGPLPGAAVTLTFGGQYAGEDIPQVTATSSLTGGTTPGVTPSTSVQGSFTPAAAGTEWVAASPALFGYRSQVFEGSARSGDLLDRTNNTLYGIAERNYLLGYDPCGIAFAALTLGCC
jgi:hypothetical protein